MRLWLWATLLATAWAAAAKQDWIAWKDGKNQGDPSSGGWHRIPRSERFQNFSWEGEEGRRAVNGYRYFFKDASHYTIGNELGERIEVWQPFAEDFPDSAVCANIRGALFNLYQHNLSQVHLTVRNSGWFNVSKEPICQEGAPCPNLILLGSSQLAERVVAHRVRVLNHFTDLYLQQKLARLQDDFPSVAYYQYFFHAHWMGTPFLSDVRLLAFNKTTLTGLNISLPAPHSLEESWSWQDLKKNACRIKEVTGNPGLLANSDFDEDFKFFTLMVQSAHGSLYKVSSEGPGELYCGLNCSMAVDVLENWWTPMIQDRCMAGHNGRGYWKNMAPDNPLLEHLLSIPEIDPVHPPSVADFSNYDYDDPDRPQGHFPGFVWTSGFDERLTIGDCAPEAQLWSLKLLNWVEPCKDGPVVLGVNLTTCKKEMLSEEFNTLTFQDGTCRLKQCIRPAGAIKLWYTSQILRTAPMEVRSGLVSVYSQHCSEILYADMPANHTFLGGSGLIIPKEAAQPRCEDEDEDSEACRRESHGWKMILELTNTKKPFISQANLLKQQSVPPPRRSLAEQKAVNPLWIPVVNAIKHGIPSQYPNVPIPESAQIEDIKPVRIALIRSILGNSSARTSLDSTCGILDELVRKCNRSRWEDDPRCVNPLDGKPGCEAGRHLHHDHFGSIKCLACPTGFFLPARSVEKECEPCPSGSYAAERGSTACESCSDGLVALSKGLTGCNNCSAGQEPLGTATCRDCTAGTYQDGNQCVPCQLGFTSPPTSPSQQYCLPKPELIWLNLVLVLVFLSILLLLPQFCGKPVAVNDIFLDEGKLVLQTWGNHQVVRWSCLPPIKVRLKGTNHYLLEEETGCGRVFWVKWRGLDELYLMDAKGQHITDDINSSTGQMWILPRCTLWGSSFCKIPAAIVMLVLLVIFAFCIYLAITNGFGEEKRLPWTISFCVLGGLATLCIYYFVWQSQMRSTPLKRRREVFRQRLLKANPWPRESPRGPDRAITAEKISELFEYFRDFIGHRDMHYVTNNLLIPFTKPWRLSYADVAGACRASWFVSHCWSNGFEDFILSLRKMAEGKSIGGNWRPVSFWICSFSNNQFKVKEELGDGDPLKSSFYLALQSPECQGTAMVLDNDCTPLQRSWCLFELLQTRYVAPKYKSGYEGLLLCTPTGVLQWGNADVDTVVRLAEKVGETRLENAQASRIEDKIMIDQCVVETVEGGFAEVNKFVHESIKKVLDEANGSFQLRVQELMRRLDREGSPPSQRVLLGRSSIRAWTQFSGAKKSSTDGSDVCESPHGDL